jgi:hypothetical protein
MQINKTSTELKFILILNSDLLFYKLLVFDLVRIREFLCLISAPLVQIILLLDVLQLLVLFIGVVGYFEPKAFLLFTFYNMCLVT